MPSTPEVHRRKIFGGIALITAPLVLGAAYLIAPTSSGSVTEEVTAMVEAAGRVELASILMLAAVALFVYAVLALVHLLREQQPWLGQIGGALAMTGLVFFAGLVGTFLAVTEIAKTDLAAGVALMESLQSNPAIVTGWLVSSAFAVGVVILAIGLLRAHTAPAWSAWLLGIGVIGNEVAGYVASDALALAGVGAMFLALAPLGYELIVEPDEAWEHPARFEGFRPVIAAR